MMSLQDKLNALKAQIKSYKKLIVAYSGGVDSTFLLRVASEVLGKNAIGVSIQTPYTPQWEQEEAKEIAKEINAVHVVLEMPFLETLHNNPKDRCYICKHAIFSHLLEFAKEQEVLHVCDGTNRDDLSEYRPGIRALRELNIISPLLEFTKSEIRTLSQELGLSTHNKPSYSCTLTRFIHDELISNEHLQMISNAEGVLVSYGFAQMRVRFEKMNARIELSKNDALRLLSCENFEKIVQMIKDFGFIHVVLDLQGYKYAQK